MSLTIPNQVGNPVLYSLTALAPSQNRQFMSSAAQTSANGTETSIKSIPVINKLRAGNPLTEFLKSWLPWMESILQVFGIQGSLSKRLGLIGSILGIIWNSYDALLGQGKLQAAWRLLSLGLATKLSYYGTSRAQKWATENFKFFKNKPGEIAVGVLTVLAFQWLLNLADQKIMPQLRRAFRVA